MSESRFYIFRINYEDGTFPTLRNELVIKGLLRQGWGAEGMDIRGDKDTFIKAWKDRWNEEITDKIYNKYRNLQIMTEIKKGDYIIIPKISVEKESVSNSFIIAVCKKEYTFSILDELNDFGHIIGVGEVFSCCYQYDHNSRIIAKSFRSYQRSLNRVWDEKVINAAKELIKLHTANTKGFEESSDNITIVSNATNGARESYLNKILEQLRNDAPHTLENIIMQLFEKNGYHTLRKNWYDKEGGDIDIVFEPFSGTSLLGNIYDISEVPTPRILVQAKKKSGTDEDAIEGVDQLIRMDQKYIEENNAIKILINLTDNFPPKAIEKAKLNDIILLNGKQFVSLLVRYGIEVI